MDEEYNRLNRQFEEINKEIESTLDNIIYLYKNVEIENINLYNLYLSLNELVNKKTTIRNKIIIYRIENNIFED